MSSNGRCSFYQIAGQSRLHGLVGLMGSCLCIWVLSLQVFGVIWYAVFGRNEIVAAVKACLCC